MAKQPPEDLMIETPIGLIKWRVIRSALMQYEYAMRRREDREAALYASYLKRMATIEKRKASNK